MIEWTEIDENNKPDFKTDYILGRVRKNMLRPEKVWFGHLESIETHRYGETLWYNVSGEKRSRVDITHFIKVANIPQLPPKKKSKRVKINFETVNVNAYTIIPPEEISKSRIKIRDGMNSFFKKNPHCRNLNRP